MGRQVSNHAWTWTEADYDTAEEFCAASLIDLNPRGEPKTKALCKLPIRDPKSAGGHVNRNGVEAASRRLHQVDAPQAHIARAREALAHLRAQLGSAGR